MNPDDFERRLSRQPLKKIPGEWRAKILREGRRAAVPEIGDADTASLPILNWREAVRAFTSAATIRSRLREIFWPAPAAWAGLAAVWILIFCVNFSMRDTTPVLAEKAAPPSPEVIVELKQQQRMLAELIGSSQARDAELPRFLPLPRSERVEILMT
jgi:hypothetical protein